MLNKIRFPRYKKANGKKYPITLFCEEHGKFISKPYEFW